MYVCMYVCMPLKISNIIQQITTPLTVPRLDDLCKPRSTEIDNSARNGALGRDTVCDVLVKLRLIVLRARAMMG